MMGFELYLIDLCKKADIFYHFFEFVAFISFILSFISGCAYCDRDNGFDNAWNKVKPVFFTFLSIFLISAIVPVFLPSSDTLCMMISERFDKKVEKNTR